MSQTGEIATLGGGCFWCLEAVYLGVEGVNAVESGYAGGQAQRPTYEQVCDGVTGHAEVVKVISIRRRSAIARFSIFSSRSTIRPS